MAKQAKPRKPRPNPRRQRERDEKELLKKLDEDEAKRRARHKMRNKMIDHEYKRWERRKGVFDRKLSKGKII